MHHRNSHIMVLTMEIQTSCHSTEDPRRTTLRCCIVDSLIVSRLRMVSLRSRRFVGGAVLVVVGDGDCQCSCLIEVPMRVVLWIGVVDWCCTPNESPVSSAGMIPALCTIIGCAMYTVPSGPETFLVHGHPIGGYLIYFANCHL